MNKKMKIIASLIAVLFIACLFYIAAKTITKYTGYAIFENKLDKFAKCLTEEGNMIYMSSVDCNNCEIQKKLFASSWKYVNATDCDNEEYSGKAGCLAIKVTQEPTWLLKGNLRSGGKDLAVLSNITGCEL